MRESLFNLMIYVFIFIWVLCLFPSSTCARSGYVSDRLLLSFRQEPNDTSAIIKTLKSDTPVIILEEKKEFYKIELQSKETGWVEKKFIVSKLPKTIIIDKLKKENNNLKNKFSRFDQLETNLKKMMGDPLSQKDITYDDLIKNIGNIQNIIQENKAYKNKNQALSQKLDLLEQDDEINLKTGMIKWFLAGAFVLLLGWIIGNTVSTKNRRSTSILLD